MTTGKYAYQVWNSEKEIVHDGFGGAATLERFAQMVRVDIEINVDDYDLNELCWRVWDVETKHYLEFKGTKLVDQG